MSSTQSNTTITEVSQLSGMQKAAVLVVAFPQEVAASILRGISSDMVEEVTREVATLSDVPAAVRMKVIDEFFQLVIARQYVDAGGMAYARRLLENSLPRRDAQRIIATIEHQIHQQPFAFLQKTEAENLLTFLSEEHPQTIALVLSHLPTSKASEILVRLEPEKQIEVVTRVANMEQTSPEVIKEVERGLENRLSGLVSEQFQQAGGIPAVAEMLNQAGRATEKAIFEGLEKDSPDLVDEIRRLMFVFEDILRINERGIQSVLKEIDNEQLAVALRTASEELKEKIFENMSERAVQLIKEEMEFMGPVRISDVENAQQKIVDVVRRLEDAGEIIISGKGDSEMVV